MMVVDTSALIAVLLGEDEAARCVEALEGAERLLLSAGTMAEALIVAERRGVGPQMRRLLDGLGFEVVPVGPVEAHRVAEAYAAWGKGRHPAGLNFGDCFAYALARAQACPLLFVGEDFRRTDIPAVP